MPAEFGHDSPRVQRARPHAARAMAPVEFHRKQDVGRLGAAIGDPAIAISFIKLMRCARGRTPVRRLDLAAVAGSDYPLLGRRDAFSSTMLEGGNLGDRFAVPRKECVAASGGSLSPPIPWSAASSLRISTLRDRRTSWHARASAVVGSAPSMPSSSCSPKKRASVQSCAIDVPSSSRGVIIANSLYVGLRKSRRGPFTSRDCALQSDLTSRSGKHQGSTPGNGPATHQRIYDLTARANKDKNGERLRLYTKRRLSPIASRRHDQ
jgi:hypothetical protein